MANTFLLKTATNLTTSLATKYTADTSSLDACVVIGVNACGTGDMTSASDGTVAIGFEAGKVLVSGQKNIVIGYRAGTTLVEGNYNTVLGYEAFDAGEEDSACTAIGYQSLTSADVSNTGSAVDTLNTAVGYQSGQYLTTGANTTFIGARAGRGDSGAVLTGSNNTAIGKDAGLLLQGAAHSNTFVGSEAGNVATTAVENTVIGFECDIQDATATNQIVIGNNVTGTADNAVHIGNDTSHIRCDFNTDQDWDASSDVRQKRDIESSELGLAFINDLNPVKYKHKSPSEFPKEWLAYNADDTIPMGGNDKYKYGFIAQEVKEVVDKYNAPDYNAWSVEPDGRQRVSKTAMIVSLVKAVQELSAEVEELKNKQ